MRKLNREELLYKIRIDSFTDVKRQKWYIKMKTKPCRRCYKFKSKETGFNPSKFAKSIDGISDSCKVCDEKASKKREEHREYIKKYGNYEYIDEHFMYSYDF